MAPSYVRPRAQTAAPAFQPAVKRQELGFGTKSDNTDSMPTLLIIAAVIAVIFLGVGIAVEALQFLLYVGLVLLVIAAVMHFVRRGRNKVTR